MASEDIIRHIIRDIVAQSSHVLKHRRLHQLTQIQHSLQQQQQPQPPSADGVSAIIPAQVAAEAAAAIQLQAAAVLAEQQELHQQLQQLSLDQRQQAPPASAGSATRPKTKDGERGVTPVSQHAHDLHSLPPPTPSGAAAGPHPPPPMTPLPQLRHLFAAGIKSHMPPTTVSDTLAAFVVRAVVLDPRNDFTIERELSRDEVQRLISLCVEKITQTNSPIMETVKMQVYFDTNFPAQADYLHREKISRITTCSSVLREIIDVKIKNINIYEALYRKIVTFIMLRSYVGSPTDMRVVREATAALESVFPQSELSTFIGLSRAEKEAQLNGLTQLVTGIRIFNKHLGKGGEAVENLIELCANELKELSTDIGVQTGTVEETIQDLLAVIDFATKSPSPRITAQQIERYKSSLVFKRQYLMYLDALQEQLEKARVYLSGLGERYDEIIRDLKNTCKSKTAVPVDQVYPQFISLASLWANWLDELFMIAFRRGILDTIDFHAKSFDMNLPQDMLAGLDSFRNDIEPEILPDTKEERNLIHYSLRLAEQDVVAKASELMAAVAIINKMVEVVHPGNTTHYYKMHVEYGGFCPYTLIRRDGIILPGDKNLGLLRYRDRLFSFSSAEGAREFAKFPDRYMEGVLEMAKRMPDLVQLLHLYSYFPTVDALENAKSFTRQRLMGQVPMVSEAGTQVDTHIVDSRFDPKYQWNEWELRRNALMLVNLKTKQTHSSQTALSHFRRESETQHYAPKPQHTQTYTESSTNVPRRVNYLAGLRSDGKPKNRFRVVDLTVDL
ncbi:hypothetical protein HK101_004586 [Irineochytrium annulatum]|nr:hypothetical protein HK101_004586 [Irineochytrium annulatum]